MAGGFIRNTRMLTTALPAVSKPTGGGQSTFTLPKVGFLAALLLRIRGSVSGTLSNPNALGMASIIKRVTVRTNSAIDLYSVSGAGYEYLLSEMLETEFFRMMAGNTGRNAVSATSYTLDMFIPIALNLRDPLGVVLLQNEQTVVQCIIDWETDSVVATGATVTGTATPLMFYYTVPSALEDYPELGVLHTILEDSQSVPASGDFTYQLPRGYTYLQVAHGLGIGASPASNIDRIRVRVNQAQFWYDWTEDDLDALHYMLRGRARPQGAAYVDYMALSGLGSYGINRDMINSALVTDFAHVITAGATGNLLTVRRQLVPIG